jgi:flagellar motor switch/type III secretory pathway protein FliN
VPENVSPEEVEALVGQEDSIASQEAVEIRDFSQPRRLSPAQQSSIRTLVEGSLPALKPELTRWLRGEPELEITGIGEASALGLFDEQQDILAIQTIDISGSQGWIVWDNEAALRTVSNAFGSLAPSQEDEGDDSEKDEIPIDLRKLTPMELGIVYDILRVFTDHLGELLGLQITPGTYFQEKAKFDEEFVSDERSDAQRLFLHIDVHGPACSSTLRIYLPGILPEVETQDGRPGIKLPTHLDLIPIQLSAVLGTADVSLSDLMAIEIGDVIPLETLVGSPVDILIEGKKSGTAQWGALHGSPALSIESIDSNPPAPPRA